MSEQPTEAQIKEFLQWCGIQCYYEATENDGGIVAWICPPDSEKTVAFYGITLDFLFKYAVPKIITRKQYFRLEYPICKSEWACQVGDIVSSHKDPALALFWAMWQIKENK